MLLINANDRVQHQRNHPKGTGRVESGARVANAHASIARVSTRAKAFVANAKITFTPPKWRNDLSRNYTLSTYCHNSQLN